MAKLLGETPSMEEVIQKVVGRFVEHFPGRWREISPAELFARIQMQNEIVRAGARSH